MMKHVGEGICPGIESQLRHKPKTGVSVAPQKGLINVVLLLVVLFLKSWKRRRKGVVRSLIVFRLIDCEMGYKLSNIRPLSFNPRSTRID